MSKDPNRLLGHTDEADGIDEYDNPLPDWWLGLFWFTIVWGLAYGIHYHFIADRSQVKELAAEMAAAEVRWPAAAQGQVEFALTDEAVAAGETIYMNQCVACHGANLEGGIGVALGDEEWIHGSAPEDVIRTITEGVLDKGMVAWGQILGPEGVNNVAAYVLSRNAELTGGR